MSIFLPQDGRIVDEIHQSSWVGEEGFRDHKGRVLGGRGFLGVFDFLKSFVV